MRQLPPIDDRGGVTFRRSLDQVFADDTLPAVFRAAARPIYGPVALWIAEKYALKQAPFVLGIAGAQGTGKTTLAGALRRILENGLGLATVAVSIDDFYLTKAARERLSRDVHPLLSVRGVPGTHDVELGRETLRALVRSSREGSVPLPRFDKATDDRLPFSAWTHAKGEVQIILFEGWCLGARPQSEAELRVPINALERDEDPDRTFRRYVNQRLAGEYQSWFADIDAFVFLEAPGIQQVIEWRCQQERELAALTEAGNGRPMSDAAVKRFVQFFERITRAMLQSMPGRADILLPLREDHSCEAALVPRSG